MGPGTALTPNSTPRRTGLCFEDKHAYTNPGCFAEYARDTRYKDIAVRMLAGGHAYDNDVSAVPCRSSSFCSHSLDKALANLQKVEVVGITEMFMLSMLLIYAKVPGMAPLTKELLSGVGLLSWK